MYSAVKELTNLKQLKSILLNFRFFYYKFPKKTPNWPKNMGKYALGNVVN